MATTYRDPNLDKELEASRQGDRRKAYLLAAFIGIVAFASIVGDSFGALAGSVPAMGRVAVGILGVVAAVLLYRKPGLGWRLAMAWAIVQVPIFAWSPDGSLTSQVLQIPLTLTNSTKVNGEIVSYTSIGIDLVGAIMVFWLRAWRYRFEE